MSSYLAYEEFAADNNVRGLTSTTFANASGATIVVDGAIKFRLDGSSSHGEPVDHVVLYLGSKSQLEGFRFAGSGMIYCHYYTENTVSPFHIEPFPLREAARTEELLEHVIVELKHLCDGLSILTDINLH